MIGGLLMAVAAVGTFVAWQQAAGGPESSYVVAARAIPPGQRLAPDDFQLAPMTLDRAAAAGAFSDVEAVTGRVSLGPIGQGELVQSAQVSDVPYGDAGSLVEVSFALPRDRAVDGRLRSGDRVDVFVTDGDRTHAVLEHVPVVMATDAASSSAVPTGDVMVTVGLEDPADRGDLIHAVRVGEVTLVRSTLGGFGSGPSSGSDGESGDGSEEREPEVGR